MSPVSRLLIASLLSVGLAACGDRSGTPARSAGGSSSSSGAGGSSSGSGPVAAACAGNAITPQRLLLQQVGATRAIVKWRGNKATGGAEAGSLCFGTSATVLTEAKTATVTTTSHREVLLTGLNPDTQYFYTIGGGNNATKVYSFRTAPANGALPADGNVRIWIVGDSGTAGYGADGKNDQLAVQDGYLKWIAANGGEPTDTFLMLGDNAYISGTDAEHQAAVFDIYTDILSATGMWPTIGNHEMGQGGTSLFPSASLYPLAQGDLPPNSPMPYLNIHTLPTNGESGGVPSGTEQYYAADHGNVHIISLDSQLAVRDASARSAMLDWLKADLQANMLDWTIVIFHHPPYTKGSHDSDSTAAGVDQPIFDMRELFTPVFEEFGVDLVYSGHSHSYERSKYIHGHTGLAATFSNATHAELNAAGQPASGKGAEAYGQITKAGIDNKVVYTVAGSSGQVGGGSIDHPAMFFSALELGSVVVDAKRARLDVRFIGTDGSVLDDFAIVR